MIFAWGQAIASTCSDSQGDRASDPSVYENRWKLNPFDASMHDNYTP